MDKLKKWIVKLLSADIIRFLIVGGCSTLIDFTIYMLLSEIVLFNIAKVVSMMISVIFSYVVSKNWTFKYKKKINTVHLVKYFVTISANLTTNLGLNYFVYSKTGDKILAYMIAVICAMTINYLLQRFLVFKA